MNKKVKVLITQAILLSILIVFSKIAIPTSFVPFTLQILAVLIISLLLKAKDALMVIATYILMGIIGIPVFASNVSGVGVFVSPSFGFVIGFMFASFLVPLIKEKIKVENKYAKNFIAAFIGLLIDYVFGFLYAIFLYKVFMVLETSLTTFKIFLNFIVIFIPFDIIKCVLATIIVKRLEDSTII